MVSYSFFATLFNLLTAVLLLSAFQNVVLEHAMLGWPQFGVMGLLVFLVVGDEFVKVRVAAIGLEIERTPQGPTPSGAPPVAASPAGPRATP